jgi:hypothetical protein
LHGKAAPLRTSIPGNQAERVPLRFQAKKRGIGSVYPEGAVKALGYGGKFKALAVKHIRMIKGYRVTVAGKRFVGREAAGENGGV